MGWFFDFPVALLNCHGHVHLHDDRVVLDVGAEVVPSDIVVDLAVAEELSRCGAEVVGGLDSVVAFVV